MQMQQKRSAQAAYIKAQPPALLIFWWEFFASTSGAIKAVSCAKEIEDWTVYFGQGREQSQKDPSEQDPLLMQAIRSQVKDSSQRVLQCLYESTATFLLRRTACAQSLPDLFAEC